MEKDTTAEAYENGISVLVRQQHGVLFYSVEYKAV